VLRRGGRVLTLGIDYEVAGEGGIWRFRLEGDLEIYSPSEYQVVDIMPVNITSPSGEIYAEGDPAIDPECQSLIDGLLDHYKLSEEILEANSRQG
jgi:hypothetical protein